MQFLRKSDYNAFTQHFAGNQPLVLQSSKLNSLLNNYGRNLDESTRRILAMPQVMGQPGHEEILWGTDQFTSQPRTLASLQGAEREHYQQILDESMQRLSAAVADADDLSKKMLVDGVTYHSPDSVYCADDRVVITEWGMHPKNVSEFSRMPLGVGVAPPPERPNKPDGADRPDEPDKADGPDKADRPDIVVPPVTPPVTPPVQPPVTPPVTPPAEPPVQPPVQPPYVPAGGQGNREPKKPWWKKALKWALIILGVLLLLWLLSMLLKKCGDDKDEPFGPDVIALPPEIDPEKDVIDSPDSLTRIVANRLILLITEGGTVNEFVKEFYTKYPDKKKYQFANPDTVIPRVVLVLPADEREDMKDRLPSQFPSWRLVVMPESMFATEAVPTDPAFMEPMKRWYFDMTEVYDAWDVTRGDKNIKVAVIDNGFDLDHPEFKGKVIDTYNAVTHTKDIFKQKNCHGTHVAGTVAALADNAAGASGIAPGCDLILVQVGDKHGQMPTSSVIDGVLYAIKSGAKVVNISLAQEFNEQITKAPVEVQEEIIRNMFLEEEELWKQIFDMADREGVTFVISGGNQEILVGLDPMQRSDKAIKVAAVAPDKSKAWFSNYGPYTSISAPGVQIYNSVDNAKYDYMDGTSMAAPIVTGGVALLKSIDPSLTTAQAVQILKETGMPSTTSTIPPIVNFGRAARFLKEKGADAINPDNPGGDNPYAPSPTDPFTHVPGYGGRDGLTAPGDPCQAVRNRYIELMQEMEKLRREHPDCVDDIDMMEIPEGATVKDFSGVWKSTSTITNTDNQQIVIYFTLNGTSTGQIDLVEPDGKRYTSALQVSVDQDKMTMHQTSEAVAADGQKYYPYDFVLVPDRDRVAQGMGTCQSDKLRKTRFNLVRIR